MKDEGKKRMKDESQISNLKFLKSQNLEQIQIPKPKTLRTTKYTNHTKELDRKVTGQKDEGLPPAPKPKT